MRVIATMLLVLLAVAAVFSGNLGGWLAEAANRRLSVTRDQDVEVRPVPSHDRLNTVTPKHQIDEEPENTLPEKESGQEPVRLVVRPNQTLEGLSRKHLGRYDPEVISNILALNPRLDDLNLIKIGETLRLPPLTGSKEHFAGKEKSSHE